MKKDYVLIGLMLMLLLRGITSHANYQFEIFNSEDGLSQNTVRVAAQDSFGFLWFGTEDGLNQFDGVRMRSFRHDPDDPHSLSNANVTGIVPGQNGHLWVATMGGLNLWDHSAKKFYRFMHNGAKNAITSVALDNNGILWLSVEEGGLVTFDTGLSEFVDPVPENLNSSIENLKITALLVDRNDDLWIGTEAQGFYYFDKSINQLLSLSDQGLISQYPGSSNVKSITLDKDKNIWVSTFDHGVYYYNNGFKNSPKRILSNEKVYSVLTDYDDSVWIGGFETGLIRYDRSSEAYERIEVDSVGAQSLPSDSIFHLMQDHNQILWISTDNGIAKLDINAQFFGKQTIDFDYKSSLNHNDILQAEVDKFGRIWFATNGGGLVRYSAKDDSYTSYVSENTINSISSNFISSLAIDDQGVWIGTANGLDYLAFEGDRFEHYFAEKYDCPIRRSNIHAIHIDVDSKLWVGTYTAGVYVKDVGSEIFTYFEYSANNPGSLSSNSITGFIEPAPGQVWIMTDNGLNHYRESTRLFSRYYPGGSNNYLASAWVGADSLIWLGTSSGIYVIDLKGNVVEEINLTHGLSNNSITGILADDIGNLWISTNNGLNRYNLSTNKIDQFFKEDGLQGNEFNVAYTKLKDGKLLFGGRSGFNIFNPNDIRVDKTFAKPVILAIEPIGLNSPSDKGLEAEKSKANNSSTDLVLPHNYHDLDIIFSGLHYKAPNRIRYRYILLGLDADWSTAEGRNLGVRYANLGPGAYAFQLAAANNNGIWNAELATRNIQILPPWWLTIWAYVGYITTALLLILSFIKWRTHVLTVRATRVERVRVFREKEKFFQNVSHELRTPLQLIISAFKRFSPSMPSFDFSHNRDIGIGNAHRLLGYVNQLLDFAVIESSLGSLRLKVYRLNEQVEYVGKMFLPQFKEHLLEFKLELEKDLLLRYDEEAMNKILNNLIANAVKYTPRGGMISVLAFSDNAGNVIIKVCDTGPGIAEDEQAKIFERFKKTSQNHHADSTGIGLFLVYQLTKALNGEIYVESKLGKGSCFILQFPHSDYDQEPQAFEHIDKYLTAQPIYKPEAVKKLSPETYISSQERTQLLVVDDEPDMLQLFTDILTGYSLLVAEDGKSGFDLAVEYIPDLIVSDVMMPNIDGFELSRKIREDENTSHIPIILVSARGDHESKMEGLSEGVNDYIVKPFDESELLFKISNLLAVRDTYAQKYRDQSGLIKPLPDMTPADQRFTIKLNKAIRDGYSDASFNVGALAFKLNMSTRDLQRKMEGAFSQSPSSYLLQYRLEQSKQLLDEGYTITQASDASGFSGGSNYSRSFKAAFDMTPTEYRNRRGADKT